MSEKINWLHNGSVYKRTDSDIFTIPTLPVGIYQMEFNSMTGEFSLEYFADKFIFDFKLYGLESDFINHVIKTYNNTSGNLGILLNGIRGTGKSVSAKILANKMNLPVIIVKNFGKANMQMIEWFAGFNFDCVLLFDEFEKNFSEHDNSILQIMDGIYTSKYRKLFILTTNNTTINENLISRPSRLRYIKHFGNLNRDVVEELLNDTLTDKSCINDLMDYIDTLKISTIDILKAIVSEVNIFGFEDFMKNKSDFNVETEKYSYKTYHLEITKNTIDIYQYDIEKFLIDCKKKQKSETISRPTRENYTEEEYNKVLKNYRNETECILKPTTNYSDVDLPFKNMKVNSTFNGYPIIQIDHSKNVLVTFDDGWDEYHFYQILNPDDKPSLYSTKVPVHYLI